MTTTVGNDSSNSNRGVAVVMASCIFLVLSVATVTAKLWKKARVMKTVGHDDWIISAALVLSVIQTIEICLSTRYGLGRHRQNVSPGSILVFSKIFYASKLTSIVVFTCAKASVLVYIITLKPLSGVLLSSQITLGVTVLWAIALFFAQAFPCELSALKQFEPQCFRSGSLDIVITTWNISTDIALVVIPYFMMQRVRVASQKRWTVILLFGSRLVVPPIAVVQLLDARSSLKTSQYIDVTWSNAIPSIWEQVCLSFSIITACVYCVKHYLKEMSRFMTIHTEDSSRRATIEMPEHRSEPHRDSAVSGSVIKRGLNTLLDAVSAHPLSNATTANGSSHHPLSNVTTVMESQTQMEGDGPFMAPKASHFERMDKT